MESRLEEIIFHKEEEIRELRLPEKHRERAIADPIKSLKMRPFIAEVKKASPSAGDIRADADIMRQAALYREGGAGAISVLTDSRYFKGSMNDLAGIAERTDLPVLCKDFILHEIQIENAYLAGADMVLLIVSVLDEGRLLLLSQKAENLGMSVLYEIHEFAEMERIRDLAPMMVGVNARDLHTFRIDLHKASQTIRLLDGDFLKIAESGITDAEILRLFKSSGADAFLIGTALMRSADPVATLRGFYSALEMPCS